MNSRAATLVIFRSTGGLRVRRRDGVEVGLAVLFLAIHERARGRLVLLAGLHSHALGSNPAAKCP
jgi:hypothetical protein